MKKILGIILLGAIAGGARAQDAGPSRWQLGFNAKYLRVSESLDFRSNAGAYLNPVEAGEPTTTIDNGQGFGADLQLGYFFGKNAHWGIATGIMYQTHEAELSMDRLRLQYQSTDFKGDVFRQVLTAGRPFSESLRSNIVSIPLLLKYRTDLGKRLGLSIDAGAVYNVSMKVKSTADAVFNYEAIYKYTWDGENYTPVYDASVTPDATDWLITVKQYEHTDKDGNVAEYFADLRAQGYNVALDQEVTKRSAVRYKAGSVGFLFQPSLTYKLGNGVGLQLGGFAMYQRYGGTEELRARRLTDGVGSYNTQLNNAEHSTQIVYGVNAGVNLAL